MNKARSSQVAVLLQTGEVLVAGGGAGGGTKLTELYDPTTGTWTLTGNSNVTFVQPTITLLGTGDALVAGGYGGGPLFPGSSPFHSGRGALAPAPPGFRNPWRGGATPTGAARVRG